MKNILAVLILGTSVSSFAGFYMDIVNCKGTTSEGIELKVSLVGDEASICGKPGKALLIQEGDVGGRTVVDGVTITENEETKLTEAKFEFTDTQEGDENKYTAILEFGYHLKTGKLTEILSPVMDGDDGVETEVTPLECFPVWYEMDCSKVQ